MMIDQLLNRPQMKGYEARRGIESLAAHLCAGLGLSPVSVEWVDWCPTAAISNSGTLVLAALKDDARITRTLFHRYVGYIVHELLHRAYTDFSVAYQIAGMNREYRRHLLNAVEDARIERKGITSTILGNIQGCLHELLQGMMQEALKDVKDWGDPAQYPFAIAVALRDYPGIAVPMPAQVKRIADEALARMPACQSTSDALSISEWIYQQLGQMNEQEEEEQEQGEEQGEEEGQDSDEQGQDGAQEDGEGEDQGDDGQGGQDGEEGGQDGEPCKGGSGKGQGEEKPKARRPSGRAQGSREVEPRQNPGAEHDTASGTWCKDVGIKPEGHYVRKAQTIAINRNVPARLRYEVRRLFDNTGTDMEIRNRKTGALDVRALAKHTVTDRLFTRRLDVEGVDSDVVLCVDLSGSMYQDGGKRITAALSTAYALIETLTAAGADVAVIGFGDSASVAVPFGTPRARALERVSRVGSVFPLMEGTNDWAALRTAHEMLLSRSAHRRVVFVISDGVGAVEAMQQQVKAGAALGITTLGIGIGERVGHIYGEPNSLLVLDPEDLGRAAFGKVKMAA